MPSELHAYEWRESAAQGRHVECPGAVGGVLLGWEIAFWSLALLAL
jgi:hypothetical protein